MIKTNGVLRNIVYSAIFATFLAEMTYNLHQLWALRERMSALEAKVDILLEDRRADSRQDSQDPTWSRDSSPGGGNYRTAPAIGSAGLGTE